MTAADSDIWIYGDGNYDWLGSSLVGLGDLDDDGFDDFAVGSTGWDGPSNGTGQGGGVFIFYGSADVASSDSWDVTGADVVLTGDESNDRIGTSIAGVGDVNGDSYDDVLIGSKYVTGLATNSGAVYLGWVLSVGTAPSAVWTPYSTGGLRMTRRVAPFQQQEMSMVMATMISM